MFVCLGTRPFPFHLLSPLGKSGGEGGGALNNTDLSDSKIKGVTNRRQLRG